MDKLWYLKKIDLFEAMESKEMDFINSHSTMKNFNKNEIIYEINETENIYLIKKGKVKLYKISEQGKEFTYSILKENELFGNLDIKNNTGSENAQSISDCMVCVINKNIFLDFMKRKPHLILKINQMMGLRKYEMEMLLEDIVFKNVEQRFYSILLRLYEKFGIDMENNQKKIDIKLTHYDISTLLGATREVTSIIISKLKKENLIICKNKNIIIKNYEFIKQKLNM